MHIYYNLWKCKQWKRTSKKIPKQKSESEENASEIRRRKEKKYWNGFSCARTKYFLLFAVEDDDIAGNVHRYCLVVAVGFHSASTKNRVSWEFFFFTVNNRFDENFIHFEDKWRDDRAGPTAVFRLIFLKQLKFGWSNKQGCAEPSNFSFFDLIKRETNKIKTSYYTGQDLNGHTETGHRECFYYLGWFVPFGDLFSYLEIICHLENLRSPRL